MRMLAKTGDESEMFFEQQMEIRIKNNYIDIICCTGGDSFVANIRYAAVDIRAAI
ncbi:hypothetical protein GCM10027155_17750 [Acinetobacter apis]|uniref:Uncharacterized protein n=1 Tax=Acinetobacter apis TaxID=1229165 RepID=A0A217EGK8_9GAMM|nr:hypothetical protein SAMN05444584_1441 [Acinetobacter apis]